ncbi:unnamed protein product [Ambrosiozyma monospora]|uniref:Unnamed protein product n=1 Tax=Ambrosiozyma monospora TaxID=43982 RepID=A0A9W6YR44_AMBMO|nr:unnamed protein product [Ambrosiozyma monospora]
MADQIIQDQSCRICHRKKIKCDIAEKLKSRVHDPSLPAICSACQEQGLKCVLVKKRKRRTNEEIEADRLREQEGGFIFKIKIDELSQQLNNNPDRRQTTKRRKVLNRPQLKKQQFQQSTPPVTHFISSPLSQSPVPAPTQTPTLTPNLNPDKVSNVPFQIDLNHLLNKAIREDLVYAWVRPWKHTKKTFTYWLEECPVIYMKDIVSKETITSLKISCCFDLPSRSDCETYIQVYFNKFETMYPVLSRSYFDANFSDLSKPLSPLMLMSILYVGCRILGGKDKEKLKESMLYYHKAKTLYDASFEYNPIFIILSGFILALPPVLKHSMIGLHETTRRVIKQAFDFNMNVDVLEAKYLSDEEKRIYKRLFWIMFAKDKMLAFCFARDCIISKHYYSWDYVMPKDIEPDYPNCDHLIHHTKYFKYFFDAIQDITVLQDKASKAFNEKRPFLHIQNEVAKTSTILETELNNTFSKPGETMSSFALYILLYSVQVLTHRVSLLRVYHMVRRCVKEEVETPGISEHLDLHETESNIKAINVWDEMFDAAYKLVNMYSDKLHQFSDVICFAPVAAFLGTHIGQYLLPYLYSDDKEKSMLTETALTKLIPVLEKYKDVINWDFSDLCKTDLEHLFFNRKIGAQWCGQTLPVLKNTSLLRSAYQIPQLKPFVERIMAPFMELMDPSFSGDYHGMVYVEPDQSPQDRNNNIRKQMIDTKDLYSSSGLLDPSTTNPTTPSFPMNDTLFGLPSSVYGGTPAQAAQQMLSIQSIINHSVFQNTQLPQLDENTTFEQLRIIVDNDRPPPIEIEDTYALPSMDEEEKDYDRLLTAETVMEDNMALGNIFHLFGFDSDKYNS